MSNSDEDSNYSYTNKNMNNHKKGVPLIYFSNTKTSSIETQTHTMDHNNYFRTKTKKVTKSGRFLNKHNLKLKIPNVIKMKMLPQVCDIQNNDYNN